LARDWYITEGARAATGCKGEGSVRHQALQLRSFRSFSITSKGSLHTMTSSLSVQPTLLRSATRSPSPQKTEASLNKPEFTASIGSDAPEEAVSTFVKKAVSADAGTPIQVTPTTSGILPAMQQDINKADKIFWNEKLVAREDFERMIATDPEYEWEEQVSAGQKFHENIKELGQGFLRVTFGVVGGYAIWRRHQRNQRENAPGKSRSRGCLV
jgi:hypothetical protein